ncbi:MAG: DNA repair protein RadC [Thermodesulfobacteriota bacterium]
MAGAGPEQDPARDPRAGHRQRLRDKFLGGGLDKFTDEEIVELLLIFGTPRRDCKQAARGLLQAFGSIRGVFEAEPGDLAGITGVGSSNIVAIKFIQAVAGRYLEQRLIGREFLASSTKVFAYLRHYLENMPKEVFKVIYLDGANAVIALEDASRGTVGAAHVYPREVLERALALQAAGLVFVHNHPSGKVQPSPSDFRLTRQLLHAAHVLDLKVVDHLIIGRGQDYFSFRDEGHLNRYEQELKYYFNSSG